MISNREKELLWEAWLGQRSRGQPRAFSAASLPVLQRMVHRRAGELRDAGYIEPAGVSFGVGFFKATDKVLEHVPAEDVVLPDEWAASRNSHNKLSLPFVWLDRLTAGRQRTLVENQAKYDWFLLHEDLSKSHPMSVQEGDIFGPVIPPLGESVPAAHELARSALAAVRRVSPLTRFDLVAQTPELVAHAASVKRNEEIEATLAVNLAWGAEHIAGLPTAQAELLRSNDLPGWVSGYNSYGNLGGDPAKWGDVLSDNLQKLSAYVAKAQALFQVLRELDQGVAAAGGWEVFRARLREKVAEAVDRKKEDASAPTAG